MPQNTKTHSANTLNVFAECVLVLIVMLTLVCVCSGAQRALACFSRRVVAGADGEARWARAALAGGAVAAKRHADRAVAERLAALPDAVKQAARRPKCGLLSFLRDFEVCTRR